MNTAKSMLSNFIRTHIPILFPILPGSLLLIAVLFTACGTNKDTSSDDAPQLAHKENVHAQLEAYTNQIFLTEITSNYLSLHYTLASPEALGISDVAVTLGQCSEKNRQESLQQIQNYKNQLDTIPSDALSKDDSITYDILSWYFDNELSSSDYSYYRELLSPTSGIQSQLPILLSEYKFRNEQDIVNYLALLSQLNSFYSELIAYENEKANSGLFMADFAVDDIIAQCKAYMKNSGQHFMFNSFDSRIDKCTYLTDEKKASYKEENKTAIIGQFFPAYQTLIDGLTALKGKGTNQGGLCEFPKGKDYYSYLVKACTGSDRSPLELRSLIDSQIQTDLNGISTLLNQDISLLDNLNSITIKEQEPTKILELLEEKCSSVFPSPRKTSCDIKYVDASLEKHLSPAFYLTPPIDCLDENTIYINQDSCPEGIQRFTTLAHEGYPGHLYQNTYTCQMQQNPIRSILSFGGYSEGFATYGEHYSYYFLDIDERLADILRLSSSVSLGLYASIDLGIHYEGWTMDQVNAFLVKYGIQDSGTITRIYHTIIEEPANYLKYYVGYAEILALKEKAETQQGSDFSLLQFHEQFLSIGEAPFSIVEKYIFDE